MTTSEASSSMVISLFDQLRVLKKSELTSKRKIFTNLPQEGTRKKCSSCSSNTKSVTPAQQVMEFLTTVLLCLREHCFVTHAGR